MDSKISNKQECRYTFSKVIFWCWCCGVRFRCDCTQMKVMRTFLLNSTYFHIFRFVCVRVCPLYGPLSKSTLIKLN